VIAALIQWIRGQRIRHYHRRTHLFGFAVLAAQINRDWPAADEFHRHMRAARAKRDTLLAKQPRCCNHDCDEGRTCPLRLAR
jgi:hypothetical protein